MAQLDDRTLAAQYGLSYDLLQQTPELLSLFRQAVDGNWSPDRFTAGLKNTNWWRTTSDTMRKYIDLRNTDPASWKQQWDATAVRINQMAVQTGIANMLGQGTNIGSMNWVLQSATWAAMATGWTDDRIKSWLGSQISYRHGVPLGGDAAQNYDKLHSLAYQNGRQYSDSWYNGWLQDIGSGRKTIEEAEGQIRQEAAAQYSAFSKQITAGMNAMDLAAPYIQSASNLLELPQGTIGLDDKTIQKAMTTPQKDGSPYSIWQFENDVRSDARWARTQNAQDATMKLAHNVLSDFGFTF